MKRELKTHRNFKLTAKLDKTLRREAFRLRTTQTRILEAALADWFSVKRVSFTTVAAPSARAALVGPEGEGLVTLPPRRSPKGGRA